MIIKIRVLPRSSKNEIVGPMADETLSVSNGHAQRGGTIKVKLTAPPVDGKANEALIELLSKKYQIPKSRIKIISGQKSKNKTLEIL
ncbi:MAG: hypothetical protein A2538_05190 [Candidatus Magasanikbacteria bacterium RIFOXYD2_FULL_41_14]|uniref:UPF0235 protein A2538_05190 n=1 Tax=Candidatus Magasanikbacteria bacterium RIFOXYD2_FULL_41_14 TaxID=1798709 RepID=A0A1F6PBQ1_9BACT|nr:MAG: hypothetical protein A2538_05190 [Candidatus Magasanikbacteria bacterium RIFOXYD2_FULL_41_14]